VAQIDRNTSNQLFFKLFHNFREVKTADLYWPGHVWLSLIQFGYLFSRRQTSWLESGRSPG